MKKIYLIATAMVSGLIAFGQTNSPFLEEEATFTTEEVKNPSTALNEKAAGVTFYTNDFDSLNDWTLDNAGGTAPEFGWSIDGNADGWWSTNGISSTSGGNFAEVGNGNTLPTSADPTAGNQEHGITYTMTTSSPISLQTYANNVTLSFEQYGARFNDLQQILVSEDGVTFFPVGDNSNFAVLSNSGGAAYPNPNVKSINLAPYVSAAATQLWIQFLWTSAFPTSVTDNAWITYGWYIDDVKLTSNPDNDVEVIDNYANTAGLFYYKIPVSQIAPIDFTAVVTKGANDITNGVYEITMNPGAVVGSSPVFNLTSSVFDTVVASVTPTGLGNYTVTSAITHDSIDDVPSNNVIDDVSFEVTADIYARDDGVSTSTMDNGGDAYEIGTMYDIWSPINCWGVDLRLGTGSVVGEKFTILMYWFDPNNQFTRVPVGFSEEFTVTPQMIDQNLTYKFLSPVFLDSNMTYEPVVVSEGGVKIARAGTSVPQTTHLYDPLADNGNGQWFYTTRTPWLRLNLNQSLGLEDGINSIASSAVYPNPTSGNTELSYTLTNAQEITINVIDVSGKELSSTAMGNQTAGEHSIDINSADFNAGIYFVNIVSNNGITTKKLIKK